MPFPMPKAMSTSREVLWGCQSMAFIGKLRSGVFCFPKSALLDVLWLTLWLLFPSFTLLWQPSCHVLS